MTSHQPQTHTPASGIPTLPSFDARERLTDADLVSLAAGGHGEALTDLYERYRRPLYAMAFRVLGDAEDAHEVLQEAFLYAWTRLGTYDSSRAKVSTWLSMITRSRSIDRLRRREHINRTRSSIEQETQTAYDEAARCDPSGFDRVVAGQRNARLHRAMERLPDAQEQVLRLSFFRGLTQREIAAEVGVPLGTVKTRSVLAMRKLRRDLAG